MELKMSRRIDFDAAEAVEQIASSQPANRTTVGQLIDDYLAAFYRDEREAGESNNAPEGGYDMEALKNFDVRAYSRTKHNK